MVDGLRPVSLAASASPIAESPVKKILFLAGLRASPMANLTVNSRLRALMVFCMLCFCTFAGALSKPPNVIFWKITGSKPTSYDGGILRFGGSSMTTVAVTKDDVNVLLHTCGHIRSTYMHYRALFEPDNPHHDIFDNVAPMFFGDLNTVFVKYLILEVCKLADPAQDFRGNANLSVEFFLHHADLSNDAAAYNMLKYRASRIREFGKKLKPARDKLISHSDRNTILSGIRGLGGATTEEWAELWLDVQAFVALLCERYLGERIYLNGGAFTDAYGLVETLRQGAKDLVQNSIVCRL
jgi:hypothetical protein